MLNSLKTTHNVIAIAIFATIAGSCGPGNAIHSRKTNLSKLYDSILVDYDGNRYSVKVFRDNNLWLTTNLKLNIPDSYCYNNTEVNCDRYGRLYTWTSAAKGCSLLGEGWRLPAKDEWQRLADLYGPVGMDSIETRKRAYHPLLYSGNAQFNAMLGGRRGTDAHYARVEAHGFYWTATASDSSTAWFANFAKGSQSFYHQNDGEKTGAFSVRCVKDIDTLK